MIRPGRLLGDIAACWPRTSGDDPARAIMYPVVLELAPHERG